MSPVVAMSHHTSVHLAEVAFLLNGIAGVWLVAAGIPRLRLGHLRTAIAGVALAVAGLLLIVATHWGELF